MSFLLSLDDLLLGGLGPQQAVLFLMDFRLSYLHRLEVVAEARTLEWVAISSSRASSQPTDKIQVSFVSFIGRQVLYH